MKIGKIQSNNCNIVLADTLIANNTNYGISETEFIELQKQIQSLPTEVKKEIGLSIESISKSSKINKTDQLSKIKSKLIDYGISIASSLSAQGIIELSKFL